MKKLRDKMKILLSKVLYHMGDLISKFLRFNCFSFLYRPYNKIMLWSAQLDDKGEVWNIPTLSSEQMNELIKEVKKRKLHD